MPEAASYAHARARDAGITAFASLIPRQMIRHLTGAPLERYFGRITFAGSHDRAMQAVQKGFVDAAFVSSSRLDEALRKGSVRPDAADVPEYEWRRLCPCHR